MNKYLCIIFSIVICVIAALIYLSNISEKWLVFTSAGNNTEFDKLWTGTHRKYDIWCVYYGDDETNYNKYKQNVDIIWKRKGSKFQNFSYIYNIYENKINEYSRVFILDDDIIISTDDINKMFEISRKYNLSICQPAFSEKSKISHQITRVNKNNILRYTNFVEVNTPLFSQYALNRTMTVYDPSLIGYGIDYLYIWANGLNHTNKYAIIDAITCINPYDDIKNNLRELNQIKNVHKRAQIWSDYAKRINAPVSFKQIEYSHIPII